MLRGTDAARCRCQLQGTGARRRREPLPSPPMSQSVLVTGASSGIGAATAKHLAGASFRVFGTTRRPESLPPGAPDIEWGGMDVCDEVSVGSAVDQVLAAAGALDGLVCNAGFGVFGSI